MTLNEALDSEKVKEFVNDKKQAKDFYAAFCNRDWFPLSAAKRGRNSVRKRRS